ncbi:unnamed protein product [Fraxinus pennsylvanica]|uniref:Xyloglucan endotransglucosylase/hydrolase n=1 Tax=Fraxinus pennsylvanica TaxID=56036 RepID=A0AAD2DV70_9LAMI|nr:unnamed protein product [Fraxinus pennsylvanica]
MKYSYQVIFFAVVLLCGILQLSRARDDVNFNVNYNITWGNDHVLSLDQGREVQLSMDIQSGSGFGSKLSYGSGFFQMRIKLPEKDSAGVVTAYYLTSHTNYHDELDFEFLGNKEGKPITLQTNVFVNGLGDREQRYYVDDIPIRIFKNATNIGVNYPSQPMQIEASLWNGDSWATDGGRTKINWSHAPFKAHFQGFNVDGCPLDQNSINIQQCYSSNYWWNDKKFWKLDKNQQKAYQQVRQKYMNYDYCSDRSRHPNIPPECV